METIRNVFLTIFVYLQVVRIDVKSEREVGKTMLQCRLAADKNNWPMYLLVIGGNDTVSASLRRLKPSSC